MTQQPAPVWSGSMAGDVRAGLTNVRKSLPAYLFYDDEGSRLFERITELPEYYLTRAEQAILSSHAGEIVGRVVRRAPGPLSVIELGAGTATKTELVLRATLAQQSKGLYVPIDVSKSALADAKQRLHQALPSLTVRPLATTYEEALHALADIPSPRLVLFLGSSVGNLTDEDASALLRRVSEAGDAWLLLGTDLRKEPSAMRAAYDDRAGVTAAFNKNVLRRINRELGGHFDVDAFHHEARWNELASCIEMHLTSARAQVVAVDALALTVAFDQGETIHTESCAKYDASRVERILAAGLFDLEKSFCDGERRFALHLARARAFTRAREAPSR